MKSILKLATKTALRTTLRPPIAKLVPGMSESHSASKIVFGQTPMAPKASKASQGVMEPVEMSMRKAVGMRRPVVVQGCF